MTVEINATELAQLIADNAKAQGSQCRIDCRPEDGRLYFAQPSEDQGDDFTIFDFYHCDMDLTMSDDLAEWVKEYIELPEGLKWK